MQIFKTTRTNDYLFLAKRILTLLLIMSAAKLFFYLFKIHYDLINFCILTVVFVIQHIIREINEERITEIVINSDQSVTYSFKTLFSAEKKATISPEKMTIELSKGITKRIFKKTTTLTFLDNNKEKFKLSLQKDGFTVSNLKQICASFIETPVPILR